MISSGLAAATLMAPALAGAPAAAAGGIGVSAPQYDSPGGTVPTIVTSYGVPPRYRAAITARGTRGAAATCTGPVWINRIRRTASRKCYLRLPDRPGAYNLVARARLTRAGDPTITRSGTGSRPILANGYRSPRALSIRRIQEIEQCSNDTERVWLTFDDGGSPVQVRSILATLARNRVRGRFFFTGAWAAQNAALMRRIRRDGHVVGNHSYTHAALSKVSRAEVRRQIARGTPASSAPRLLRPPFAAGAFTSRLRSLAAAQGYELCRWTVDTYDWHGVVGARMVERVRYGDALTPPVAAGGNVLMHGTGRHTARALQPIIDAVESEGLVLDPLP